MTGSERARGLTSRGRGLLVVGLILLALGVLGLGPVSVSAGALLVGLVTLSASLSLLSGRQPTVHRVVRPQMVAVGGRGRVTLTVGGGSPWQVADATLVDHWPAALGPSVRAHLPRIGRSDSATVHRTFLASHRGSFRIGPASLVVSDPFGVARRSFSMPGVTTVTITPQVQDLRGASGRHGWAWVEGTEDRASVTSGPDDSTIRPYVDGDDRRRIHWRASARHDALMTRNEERVRHSRVTILLDTRPGKLIAGERRTEWLVEAAASIAVHLHRSGVRVRLLSTAGTPLPGATSPEITDEVALLRSLGNVVATGPRTVLGRRRGSDDGAASSGRVIALLTEVTVDDLPGLAEMSQRAPEAHLILPADTDAKSLPDRRTTQMVGSHGWQVVIAAKDEPLRETWLRVGQPASTPVAR